MSILSWNCQGAGSKETVRRLEEMCQYHSPDFIFLLETKQNKTYLEGIKTSLGYSNLLTVEPIGRSGGLAVIWKSSFIVEVLNSDSRIIDLRVTIGSLVFFLTCVYGDPVRARRAAVWNRLTAIGILRDDPWVLVGDFNELLSPSEKLGGPNREEVDCLDFKLMAENCNIRDFRSIGNVFSWTGWRDQQYIQCRLDRCFGNDSWFNAFPRSSVEYLKLWGSDHRPILARFTLEEFNAPPARFSYDARLGDKEGVDDIVAQAWSSFPADTGSLMDRISSCRKALSSLKRSSSLDSSKRIRELHDLLEAEVSKAMPSAQLIRDYKARLITAYNDEEKFWKNKSKVNWLKNGDQNTRFFHNCVKGRRFKNRVQMLKDANNVEYFDEEAKGRIAVDYFTDLFTSTNPQNMATVLSTIPQKVTPEMNSLLTRPVSAAEIKDAVFSIKGNSSPGPDGFPGSFYTRFWSTVGPSIVEAVTGFFESGQFPQEWNQTHICLIPKVSAPTRMQDLRPISLCSMHYKIISKILCDRLKLILPQIVSETQGAFVEGRLISDNIIIAHELTHALRTDPTISSEYMAIKSDMSKAFDRVEWSFIQALLLQLGFSELWTAWIMTCISSVSYSVLLNGKLHGDIKPERGLRQGDPLSPFLFILGAEAFISLLNDSQRQGKITGISFGTSGPALTHLLFADDSLLLCKATTEDVHELVRCLEDYGAASGQMINFHKSSVTFGANVEPSLRPLLKHILRIELEGGAGTYLGLPECFSGSKRQLLRYIHDKLKSRLQGWFTKALSQGGKEILLKSICLALPVYAMSCFRLPKDLCKRLTSAMTEFWWSNGSNRRKISWVAWKKLCTNKEDGGLGFHDISDFNQSLLAKQAWRLLENPDSLFAKVLKARYFEEEHFLVSTLGARPSFVWRSITYGRELLFKGLLRSIGDGRHTLALNANWIWDNGPRRPVCASPVADPLLRVVDLIDRNTYTWKRELIQDLFIPSDAAFILAMKISSTARDSFIWGFTPHGRYTSQSGYRVLRSNNNPSTTPPLEKALWSKIWKIKTQPKLKHFFWKCLSGALPVAERLQTRGVMVPSVCSRCSSCIETICHSLFTCPHSQIVWDQAGISLPPAGFSSNSVFLNVHHLVSVMSKNADCHKHEAIPWIIWEIWKSRNALIFERTSVDSSLILQKAMEGALAYTQANAASSSTSQRPFTFTRWSPPRPGFRKCNFSSSWSNPSSVVGLAWILRDEFGTASFHGRNFQPSASSRFHADLQGFLWAAESLSSMRCSEIVFETTSSMLSQAILKPWLFPSQRLILQDIFTALSSIPNWSWTVTTPSANSISSRMASSATSPGRHHSYIEVSGPSWLAADLVLEAAFL